MAALLSKTVTVSVPAVLLVILWWKRGRITRRDVVLLIPFFAIGMALALVTVTMEKNTVGAEGAAWDLSVVQRFLVAGHAPVVLRRQAHLAAGSELLLSTLG